MVGIISILLCACKYAFLTSLLSENTFVFTHASEARKANLNAYKRITIKPSIYERGLLFVSMITFSKKKTQNRNKDYSNYFILKTDSY